MATAADIEKVRDNLPSVAVVDGWDDAKIESKLDGGNTTSETIRDYWSYKVANTADFVSVSESGSSRDLASIHKHAVEMLKYWDDKIRQEEEDAAAPEEVGRIAFHPVTRI